MNRVEKFQYIKTKIPFKWFDFAVLIVLGLIILLVFLLVPFKEGERVNVYIEGDLKYTYSLYEEVGFEIKNGENINKVKISNGKVKVISSNCANQNCVLHGEISMANERIVCLPHKLVIEISGEEVDAVS